MEENKELRIIKIVEVQGTTSLISHQSSLKEYEPSKHIVHDIAIRKKKEVKIPNGTFNDQGIENTTSSFEEVNRISLPLQKLIVARRAAFMNVGAMKIKASPITDKQKQLLAMVEKCREDNKLRYKAKEIAKRMMSELQVAELWYSESADAGYWGELAPKGIAKMRMKILSPSLGDELLPVFNSNGDLVYFGRKYKTPIDYTDLTNQEIEIKEGNEVLRFDIYTSEKLLQFKKGKDGWLLENQTAYSYGKMPIIYYSQPEAEWADVQGAITRVETAISNLGDVVDYNGSPILVASGDIKNFAKKGESGKVLELELGASVNYVSWDAAPESIRLELNTLLDFVYTCTQTPNISFQEMKGLGGVSGVAFDRVFMDAHLAAQAKLDGVYGECLQRQLNFLKSACITINSTLKSEAQFSMVPEVPLFRINDLAESITNLSTATTAKIVSQKTAVEKLGLANDIEEELKQLGIEAKSAEMPTN